MAMWDPFDGTKYTWCILEEKGGIILTTFNIGRDAQAYVLLHVEKANIVNLKNLEKGILELIALFLQLFYKSETVYAKQNKKLNGKSYSPLEK